MPYKSTLIQSVLGALGAVAFVISAFSSSEWKVRKVVGEVQKIGGHTVALTEENSRHWTFQLTEATSVFLNERKIPFAALEDGRKVAVFYKKVKGMLYVSEIDIFPNATDFSQPPGERKEFSDV